MLSSIRRCEYLLYMVYDLKKSAIQWKRHDIKAKRVKKKKKAIQTGLVTKPK